jgi:hypothetical protein
MRNQYRVDRALEALSPPCGMNSILYVGDNYPLAMRVFHATTGGKDAWNVPNRDYGVMLSIWHPERGVYVAKRWKSK